MQNGISRRGLVTGAAALGALAVSGLRPAMAQDTSFAIPNDPHEMNNLAADPDHAGTFRLMLGKLDEMMARIGDIPEHVTPAFLAARAA